MNMNIVRMVAEMQAALRPLAQGDEPVCQFRWRIVATGEIVTCLCKREWAIDVPDVGTKLVCLTHAEYLEMTGQGKRIRSEAASDDP